MSTSTDANESQDNTVESQETKTETNEQNENDAEIKYFCHICDGFVENVTETEDGSFRCSVCGGMIIIYNYRYL